MTADKGALLADCDTSNQYDVIIVGFGPVGATLAALLGQRGVKVLVVEPEREIYPLPRAAHVDHEIMRIFQGIGITDAIAPHIRVAPDYEFRAVNGEAIMRVERAGLMGASGWPVSFNIYQPGIEAAIRATVAGLETVTAQFGTRFTGLIRNDSTGVTVALEQDGVVTPCNARFLIGCDGSWSPVREACHIALDDYRFDEPWLVLDARVPDESGFPPMNLQLCDPERPTTFVHMGPGRLRWEFMLKPGESVEAMTQPAALDALLARWRGYGEITVERHAAYRFHGLVAAAWRSHSVFIAGDAAHQMPPFMGQGLCSGLRDAVNLAWKLEAVIRGQAGESLLDTYQQERDPHVRYIVERAIDMGSLVCTLDPVRAATRDAEMLKQPRIGVPAAFPSIAAGCILEGTSGAGVLFPQAIDIPAKIYLDDWLGTGPCLLYQSGAAPAWSAEGLRTLDVATLHPVLAQAVTKWLDLASAEAVLVRPDRYVFGSGRADDLVAAFPLGNEAGKTAGSSSLSAEWAATAP